MNFPLQIKSENGGLAVYSFCHFAMDALSAFLLYAVSATPLLWILGYHAVAFAMQPLFGVFTDKYPGLPYGKISAALIFVGYFLSFMNLSAFPVFTAGLANALFHLEGGYVSMHRRVRTISPLGIFVSCGAIGIGLAHVLGGYTSVSALTVLAVLGLPLLVLTMITPVGIKVRTARGDFGVARRDIGNTALLGLLFAAICIRGYAGFCLPVTELSGELKLMLVAAASFGGKFLGGILADMFGARRVAVLSQALAVLCPLVLVIPSSLIFVFLINIPMAITLGALGDVFPNETGLAFGIAPLGLFASYMAAKFITFDAGPAAFVSAGLMAVSALVLWVALRR